MGGTGSGFGGRVGRHARSLPGITHVRTLRNAPDPDIVDPLSVSTAASTVGVVVEPLPIPAPALVVLVGPAGAGKSTWAAAISPRAQSCRATRSRAWVGEGDHDVAASNDAFWLLEQIVQRRLQRRLTAVVDSLGLDAAQRARWRTMAAAIGVPCVAIVFETPTAECRRRNAARALAVPAEVIRSQLRRWPSESAAARGEPWDAVLPAAAVSLVPATLAPRARQSRSGTGSGATPDAGRAPVTRRAATGIPIGLHLSSFDRAGTDATIADRMARIAVEAEEAGVAHLWVMDHLRQIPQQGPAWEDLPEAFTTLAWLAARTQRVQVGTLVAPAFLRPLAVMAKLFATLDVLSAGRAICGLGVGWFEQEYRAAGVPFPPLAERYERLEDALRGLPAFWGRGAPAFAGHRIEVPEALSYPRPIQPRIPVWIGGSGPRTTLRLVARHADGCNLFGEPEVVRARVDALTAHCAAVGRDLGEITVSQLSTVLIGRSRAEVAALVEEFRPRRWSAERFAARVNAGTVDDHVRRIERFVEAGVDTVIVSLADIRHPAAVERLAMVVAKVGNESISQHR